MLMLNIQHLRAVAVLLVVLHHLVWLVNSFSVKYASQVWMPRPNGQIGVDIFFVISGFIMVHTAGSTFGAKNAGRTFLKNRVIRIVPLYWVATALETAVLYISHSDDASGTPAFLNIFRSFFFLPYESEPDKFHPILGVGWTLNCEMFFYVVFAICLALPLRAGLALLASTFIAMVIAGSFFALDGSLKFWASPLILEFLLGVSLGLAFRSFDRQLLPAYSTSVAALIVVLIGACLTHDEDNALGFRPLFWTLSLAVVAIAVFSRQPSGVFSKAFEKIGDSSYSLYLTHSTAVTIGLTAIDRVGVLKHLPPTGLFVATVVGAIIWGLVVNAYVEKPLIKLFRPRLRPRFPLQPAE